MSVIPMKEPEGLWTKAQVARYLGVAVRTVERMDIPRIQMAVTGQRPLVRFDPVQVRLWVDKRRTRQLPPELRKAS